MRINDRAALFFGNLSDAVRRMPMVPAVAVLVAGVLFFDRFDVPAFVPWVGFAVFCLLGYLLREGWSAAVAVSASIFLFAGASMSLWVKSPTVEPDRRMYMEMEVSDVPSVRADGSSVVAARITACEKDGVLCGADERVRLWCDGSVNLSCGDRIGCLAGVKPFYGGGAFGRMMMRRGYAGTVFLREADIVSRQGNAAGRSLHAAAVSRLAGLELSPQAAAVVRAMGAGDRGNMSPALRDAYARVGVSHILAVSGLHTGIVFLLANLLFGWVAVFRYGNIIRNVIVASLVWVYAAMCGFAPSAVRAAAMFTMLQLSAASSSVYTAPNTLAAAAFFMVAVNPDTLFEAGFQLSFIAVAGILLFGMPVFASVRRLGIAGRFLWGTLLAGVVASAVTAPLTAHLFGRVSFVGAVVNPAVILCAYVIVGLSVLWTAMPLPLLMKPVSALLQLTADIQNAIVVRTAALDAGTFDCELSAAATAAIYGVLAAGVIVVLGVGRSKEKITLNLENEESI